ncbi:Cyclic nucleotide-binding protein [Pseudocohnilembus persalinus]|uniref:Cyclic nucleotide-binding protein n=1 Tax=Pseudocohnilembus persalinus TaxID=266149 RepID=A0A0V0QYC1_PSEPJ|nr:Cyclic nucleotide-binding protein [Pseudocohnilembus persalinus]|eukprot:KRX07321.1 Cyclic nucleotide-binding protein [Pseudocohnilembus persalinus]
MANRFFKNRKIPEKLRERISSYLEFVHQEEMEKNQVEEETVLGKLSEQLRIETINNTLTIIKEENYSPGDYITSGNNKIILFINRSKIKQQFRFIQIII